MEDKEELGCASGCAGCSGCGHDHENDEVDPIVTLTDDEGNEVDFEILDVVVLDDEKQYLVVAKAGEEDEEENETEVVILSIDEVDGEEVYDTVTDEELAKKVFEAFKSQYDGAFEEDDEDDDEEQEQE